MPGRLAVKEMIPSMLYKIKKFYFDWKYKITSHKPVDKYLRLVESSLSEYLKDIEREFSSRYGIKFNNIRRDPIKALEVCLNKFHSRIGTNHWFGLSILTSYFLLHISKINIEIRLSNSCIFDMIKEIKKLKPKKKFFRDLWYRFLISRRANLDREIDTLMDIEDMILSGMKNKPNLYDYLKGTPIHVHAKLNPKYASILRHLMFKHTFVNVYLEDVIYLRHIKDALSSDNARKTVDILCGNSINDLKLKRLLLAKYEAVYQKLEQYVRRIASFDDLDGIYNRDKYLRYKYLLTEMLKDKDILNRYGYVIRQAGPCCLLLDTEQELVTNNSMISREKL